MTSTALQYGAREIREKGIFDPELLTPGYLIAGREMGTSAQIEEG